MFQTLTVWLKNSSYGQLTSIIRELFPTAATQGNGPAANVDNEEDDAANPAAEEQKAEEANEDAFNLSKIRLPRIIVVGTESSGKSTLLQRITNRRFFPQHFQLGTKCPTVLRLYESDHESYVLIWRNERFEMENAEAIATRVEEIMNGLDTHVEEQLTIEIQGPDLSNFELIDIPGMIALQNEAAEKVKKIVESYMSDPDTLVLCVVSADTSRLNSNLAVAKVIEFQKQSKTILCLTKCDNVNKRLYDPLIVKRVLMDREMQELDGTQFAGVVATACLDEEDFEAEAQFFDSILPLIKDHELLAPELAPKLRSNNIIRILDDLYHGYITNTWCPNVMERIRALIEHEEAILNALGKSPEVLTPTEIWREIQSRLPDDVIFTAIDTAIRRLFVHFKTVLLQDAELATIMQQPVSYATPITSKQLAAVKRFSDICQELMKYFMNSTQSSNAEATAAGTTGRGPTQALPLVDIPPTDIAQLTADTIVQNITTIFQEQRNEDLKISRFAKLQEVLQTEITRLTKDTSSQALTISQMLFKIQLTMSNITATQSVARTMQQLFEELENHATLLYNLQTAQNLQLLGIYVDQTLNDQKAVVLEEVADIAGQRRQVMERIAELNGKYRNIEHLEEFQRREA